MTNENFAVQFKLCLAAALGTLTALWGWFGWLVLVWAALMRLRRSGEGREVEQRQDAGRGLAQGRHDRNCLRGPDGGLADRDTAA